MVTETKVTELPVGPRGHACPHCGSPVEPHDKFCQECGHLVANGLSERHTVAQKHLRCQNCGAEITIDFDQRSYVCPFCDSTYVVEFSPSETGRQSPEFVIGFAITPEQALQKFRSWISAGGWFRPGDLHKAKIEEKLKGVYLPFWSFSMRADSGWSASIGEYWYRTETYTTTVNGKRVTRTRRVRETEWWPLSGGHHRYYSGYLVSGSRGLAHEDAERIKPFQLPALKRYQPYFLAGWLSEEYSVPKDQALIRCQGEFTRQEHDNVAAFMPGDTHSRLQVRTQFSQINSDLVLLPVYLLTYRYRDKIYRFLLNGQTGRTAGDKPLSAWRIAIAVIFGLVIALLVALAVMSQQ